MGRVILNLIDNVIKYGMIAKKLKIAVYKREEKLYIEVEDFGVGWNKSRNTRAYIWTFL